ncbi:uncharacterized protein FOMMEDRAFT_154303 [Fomitiporia mediterranea MF3/22]|uniref:uncharacterized protein n=1 Tax=Fomitiporia mediterranea (strain MF3/22) TaxID=694068 RepID=UPI0004408167|nr:uncharacterized protein FOMMEDRAFT_154303 [Fomitiporia mediterranea MF3/22]EJD05119.1 hypothetical protein FOMMEDRAFT_154303 [Fomitiporia mediterranea MF3/22]
MSLMDPGILSKTPYLDAVSASLPSVLSDLLITFDIFSRERLDTLVRFCAGGVCPPRIAGHANAWQSGQTRLQARLAQIEPSTGEKRVRSSMEEDGVNGDYGSLANGGSGGSASKKPKLALGADDGMADTEALYTLHSLSISAPVRKKVDISITQEAIRLTNPSTGSLEARIPLTTLKRAFLISNLAKNKNKEQWAVTLISADTYDKKADAASQVQLTFNVDKTVPGGKDGLKTTSGAGAVQVSHPKGADTLPILREFLSHLPSQIELHIAEKKNSHSQAFKSSSGEPYVDAYLGAKEGSLCFLPRGILWANARPCGFYALEDLAMDSEVPGLGGVKTLSATGRTFSVFIRRRVTSLSLSLDSDANVIGEGVGSDYGEAEEEEEEECEEIEFAMIDGREQENVNLWIRKYKHYFGKPRETSKQTQIPFTGTSSKGVDVKGKGKGKGKARVDLQEEVVPVANDDGESDASDEDYSAPSDSDGGEPTSESDNDSGVDEAGEQGDDEEEEAEEEADLSGEDENEEAEDEDEETEEMDLDPARHLLLRPGAMPLRMSKAAMEAAVAMVTQDLAGSGVEDEDEEDEEEVDQLE